MRCVIQRVLWAHVTVEGASVGKIGPGALVLLGVGKSDTEQIVQKAASKIAQLRFFTDDQGRMNRSLLDVRGACLVVSQFTLYGDCTQGRRPFFGSAQVPDVAEQHYLAFVDAIRATGVADVATGRFGAHMEVSLCNDGPVTLWLDF